MNEMPHPGFDKPEEYETFTTTNGLEEAANEYEKKHTYQRYDGGGFTPEYDATLAEAVIFGAKWQKEQDRLEIANIKAKLWQDGFDDCRKQMMKEAVKWLKETGANNLYISMFQRDMEGKK